MSSSSAGFSPVPPVALSTASVYPEPAPAAFELAAELGYDGIELMVWSDPVSQDLRLVRRLSERHGVPVLAVHAPCLAITQRVWGSDPIGRIRRSVDAAARLDARTVVLHPPFRWQRRYAARFADEVARAGAHTGVRLAVENMFPVTRAGLRTVPYSPGFDPTESGHRHYTLDLSHTAAARSDALAMLDRMGDGLVHLHLGDGTGAPRDEHLVPGRGDQPCAEVCERLARSGFGAAGGTVVVEVSTRRCRTRHDRAAMLAESLLFARLHLQPTAAPADRPGPLLAAVVHPAPTDLRP
ncbi:TIM barrel protein [Pseudonocardia acidicola]|uniref:Sugar phosphate isomerase/epimerase n=1 Tax=Pseudonocardia acidicola TaxID=2724939 RepID=A0ABX1SCV0_9PSEU|nr:sugar phosphate isomerase/epimerase [Pseudonocardia acidicola]